MLRHWLGYVVFRIRILIRSLGNLELSLLSLCLLSLEEQTAFWSKARVCKDVCQSLLVHLLGAALRGFPK